MSKLADLAEAATESARRAGAEWADAVCASYRDLSVSLEKSSIRECETAREQGLGVRAYCRGGRGTATVLGPTLAEARRCGRQAAELARGAHPDPAFVALPQPAPVSPVPELFDERVAALSVDQVVRWCVDAIAEAREVCPDALLSGGTDVTWGEKALVSSTGVRLETRSSRLSASFSAVVRRDGDVGLYSDFDMARRLADFQPRGVAAAATREAVRFLGACQVPTRRLTVLFGPLSAYHLIMGLVGAASAEGVQRKRSFLAGKAGEQVASSLLTVREDPFIPAGVNSQCADGEGVPKVARDLLAAGVLTTYLHNSYTANKAQSPNTAHAARGGYDATVGIGVSNVLVQPGARTAEELVADIDEGICVSEASLSADAVSGDISATVDFGFRIQGGKVTHPVHNTMIGGNLLDWSRRIVAVSADYREEPGWIMPSLVVEGVQISGGG